MPHPIKMQKTNCGTIPLRELHELFWFFCQVDTAWIFWRTRICLKFLLQCGLTSCGNAAHTPSSPCEQFKFSNIETFLSSLFTGSSFCSKLAKSFRIFHLTTFHLEMMNPFTFFSFSTLVTRFNSFESFFRCRCCLSSQLSWCSLKGEYHKQNYSFIGTLGHMVRK